MRSIFCLHAMLVQGPLQRCQLYGGIAHGSSAGYVAQLHHNYCHTDGCTSYELIIVSSAQS